MRAKPNKETTKNVPAFLTKLFTMVSDPDTDELIRWSDDGDSFFVPSADRMGKELLPHYFKHQNFGSFVRQLNMYGFHKVPHLQQGVLKRENGEEGDMLEFSNANFQRGQPDLLCMIHRKVKGEGAVIPSGDGTLDVSSLLTDLAAIRKHQTAISADLKDLQARNHALWQEAVQSREKHKKQEETINRILRFLAGVFGGQVVDQGGAAPAPQVVQGEAAAPGVPAPGVGAQSGSGNGVVLMPKGRLLLEDVKGRQGAALRELDGSDEEIEEIPLLRGDDDGLPTISSSLVASAPTASMGTLTRAPSASSGISNRFTAIPSPANSSALPTPTDGVGIDPAAQYGFTAETLGALAGAAGGATDPSSAFSAFFSQPPPAPTSLAPPPDAQTSTALMPFIPTPTSNPLSNPFALAPAPPSAAPGAMSPTFANALAENNSAVASLLSEKADIDSRTSALEAQIARLMETLPSDAREQVEGGGGGGALGLPATLPELPTPGAGAGEQGFDWSGFAMDDGGIDFDKMLAQFSEIANPTASNFLPSTSSDYSSSMPSYANGVTDYSDILSTAGHGPGPSASSGDPPLDPALFAPSALPALPAYEVTSPASSAAIGSPASTAESAPTPASTTSDAGRRKRKSDVLSVAEAGSPAAAAEGEGTRRSQRKRRA
ncbi:Heat shock transcription factor [Rhodotorula kratochvilovae]